MEVGDGQGSTTRVSPGKRPRSYVIGASGPGLLPAVIAFVVAVLWPSIAIFERSLQRNPLGNPNRLHETWDNYLKLFTEPLYVDAMLRTIRVSVIGTVLSILISLAIVIGLTVIQFRYVEKPVESSCSRTAQR